MVKIKKKAFTLMELIVVIAILAILMAGLAFYGSNSVKRTKIQTTESYLKVLASDMEAAFDDYGSPILVSSDDEGETEESAQQKNEENIAIYCEDIADDYLHTDLDCSSDGLVVTENGFAVKTIETDPWGTPYTIYYITATEDTAGSYIIISNGPDMLCNYEEYFTTGNFADDIVLTAVMKH